MTKIYLIRHCEGEGNIKRIFNGTTDCDISDIGVKQLEKLAERFKDIPIDAIYSSPLIRAKKTAQAVADIRGLTVNTDKELMELYGGQVEGKPFKETFEKMPHLKDAWDNHPQDFHPIDGESMRHAYERIYAIVVKLAKQNDGKTIVVASHGGVIRCLLSRLLYGTIDRLKEVPWCENTDVSLLEYSEQTGIKVVFHSDHSHLTPELMPKRSKISEFSKEK